MISGSKQIYAGIEQIFCNVRSSSESSGSVLGIGKAKINAVLMNQTAKLFLDQFTTRLAEYIT